MKLSECCYVIVSATQKTIPAILVFLLYNKREHIFKLYLNYTTFIFYTK